MPIDSRKVASVMPKERRSCAFSERCVVEAGCAMSDFVSPIFTRCENSLTLVSSALAACALLSALLVAVVPVLDPRHGAILAVLVLWGGISFGIYTVGLALLGQRFHGGDIARANAAFTIMYTLGGLIGRPAAGKAMDLAGGFGLGGTVAFIYLVAGFGALLALRRNG